MSTFEWLSLIGVLGAGFWTLSTKLSKIETALHDRVSYEDCSVKREKCPCVQERNERLRLDLSQTRTINRKDEK